MIPFLVSEFSKHTVSNLVKECFGSEFPDVFNKPQINYIFQYANDLGAKTVLLERDYLDKDYLEDFSRYYVKCFKNGGQRCARLHFFSSVINHSSFSDLLKEGAAESLKEIRDSYIGFTVIKPLVQTFIGKTCLRLYNNGRDDGRKRICLFRPYSVNLFGINLEVKTTAFQEQDKVVSACATTAIWSALHAVQDVNIKQVPACSEITIDAINFIDGSTNGFPNHGLTNTQILRAIDKQNLKYHSISLSAGTSSDLLDIIRYHIDSKIPLILGGEVFARSEDRGSKRYGRYKGFKRRAQYSLGGHAVTILGYLQDSNEIYIHDDRLGPFAKSFLQDVGGKVALFVQERDSNGDWQTPSETFVPNSLIIPAHKKVRISYQLPLNTCKLIFKIVQFAINENKVNNFDPSLLKFSLRLQNISDIRQHIIEFNFSDEDKLLLLDEKLKILTRSMARFQWVASFKINEIPAFKILFDATDIPQGNAVTDIFTESFKLKEFVFSIIAKYSDIIAHESQDYKQSFIPSLLRFINKSKNNYFTHLNEQFGELRAPQYLKEEECNCNRGDIYKSYTSSPESLEEIHARVSGGKNLIWAISHDGALLIGKDLGHPVLTGLKPARIAGELLKSDGKWIINGKSGRYSKDYKDSDYFLKNALNRFKITFSLSDNLIDIGPNS